MQINSYLFFNGRCEEAFKFYAEVLGGEIEMMMTHEGTPAQDLVSPEWCGKIMHARMRIGDQLLMASDAPPERSPGRMQGFSVNVGVSEPAEAERIFHALAEGGEVRMPIGQTFWALRFGMCVDRFGTPWMINCEAPR
jgi:PhnB protein